MKATGQEPETLEVARTPKAATNPPEKNAQPPRITTERGRGRISGRVLAEDGTPLGGLSLVLQAESAPLLQTNRTALGLEKNLLDFQRWVAAHRFQTTTDANGEFLFDRLPDDIAYGIRISSEDYRFRSVSPVTGLYPSSECLFIGERIYPVALTVQDHRGTPVFAAHIAWRAVGFPPPLNKNRLPQNLDPSEGVPSLRMDASMSPALPVGWYFLQAFSADGLAKSSVVLIEHRAREPRDAHRLILQRAGKVLVRPSPPTNDSPLLRELSVHLLALPDHLDEQSKGHATIDVISGLTDNERPALFLAEAADKGFDSVRYGRHRIVISRDLQIVFAKDLDIDRELTIVPFSLPELPPLELRTIALTGIREETIDAPEVFLQRRGHHWKERLKIVEQSAQRLKVLRPDSHANEFAPTEDLWLITGTHPVYGVAQSVADPSPLSVWKLDFRPAADLLLQFTEEWLTHPEAESVRYSLHALEADAHFSGFFATGAKSQVIGNIPYGQAELKLEVLMKSNSSSPLHGSVVAFKQRITVTPQTTRIEVPWPQGYPLTIIKGRAPWPRYLNFQGDPVDDHGSLNVFIEDSDDSTFTVPYFPAGSWRCRQSDSRARHTFVDILETPFQHFKPSVIHIKSPRIVAWTVSSLEPDSLLARAGARLKDEITAWNGESIEGLWDLVANPSDGQVYSSVTIRRGIEVMTLRVSARLAATHAERGTLLGARIEPRVAFR